jgi:hypothetical protein
LLKLTNIIIFLALNLLVHTSVHAATTDVYEVTIPVTEQSPTAFDQAARAGLAAVVVRVSGDRAAADNPTVQRALPQAQEWVKRFSYQQDADNHALQLQLSFEPQQIDRLLRDAGLPQWSGDRPTILLLLVLEQDGKRQVVEPDNPIVAAINDHAQRRGITIELPQWDFKDKVALSVNDLWQLDAASATPALKRYQPEVLLIGRGVQLFDGAWLGNWLLVDRDASSNINVSAASSDAFIGTAIDDVTDILAASRAVAPVNTAQGSVLMRVLDVRDFTDYAAVVDYLNGLAAVRSVDVITIDANELMINLAIEGGWQPLQQQLEEDRQLVPVPTYGIVADDDMTLDYRWVGDRRQQTD